MLGSTYNVVHISTSESTYHVPWEPQENMIFFVNGTNIKDGREFVIQASVDCATLWRYGFVLNGFSIFKGSAKLADDL